MAASSDERFKMLVAALDFGTTYSGYAFSFKADYTDDPSKITANTTWTTGSKSLFSQKTPTCLLLRPDQTFHSFGFEAEEHYSSLVDKDEHHSWYYFRRFKMLLHNNMELTRDTKVRDESREKGKELPALDVFVHSIRYLKNHLLNHLKKKSVANLIGGEGDEYIHWVLTIPAIWNDRAKQFMREAAKKAGIKSTNLSLALEPEAAALFCKILPLEKQTTESGTNLSMLKPGTRYMVLDLGGGTVDVTVQEVLPDHTLKELHKASGGAWGGTKIDEAFLQLIISIVGAPVFQQFKEKYPKDYLELVQSFETKKRAVNTSSKETFRIPVSLVELFETESEEELNSLILQTRHRGKLKLDGDKLIMYGEMISEMFKHSRESIVEHVESLFAHPFCKDVDKILMVGGFSECVIIQEAIKKRFPNKRVVIPPDAGLAIVKGAVLFGHNPKMIISRNTKWTYGVQTNRNFKPGDPPDKMFKVGNVEKCKEIFSVHIGVNKTVEVGTPLPPKRYRALHRDDETIDIPIYISSEEQPEFTTDSSCSYLGKLTIELQKSNSDREIEVGMTFGGTELVVEAKGTKNKEVCVAQFDFLESKDKQS